MSPGKIFFPFPLGDPAPTKHIVTLAHHSPQPERHLDRFSRFCRSHGCVDRPTDRLTHTPTDHATPIATGRIYALHYDALYSEALQQSQTWFCYGNILSVPRLLVK